MLTVIFERTLASSYLEAYDEDDIMIDQCTETPEI